MVTKLIKETAKFVAYRVPVVSRLFAPKFPYKVSPGELAYMCDAIDATRGDGGAVIEVGVARGYTSLFLLEHMKTMGDSRQIIFLDTFAGFTTESIEFDRAEFGGSVSQYTAFRYGAEEIFSRNMRDAGYSNFRVVKGDAAKFDYSKVGGVSAMLLDIDVYKPTMEILDVVFPLLTPNGSVCVDDCSADVIWPGAFKAYKDFTEAHGLEFRIVGGKGGIIRKRK